MKQVNVGATRQRRVAKRNRSRRRKAQLRLAPKGMRGGWRPGAGRKRGRRKVAHRRRPGLASRHPVHVTLRLIGGLPSLRRPRQMRRIRRCIQLGHKEGFRVAEYSVLSNHLHFIVEASDEKMLGRGMQGLTSRLARRLNER